MSFVTTARAGLIPHPKSGPTRLPMVSCVGKLGSKMIFPSEYETEVTLNQDGEVRILQQSGGCFNCGQDKADVVVITDSRRVRDIAHELLRLADIIDCVEREGA